jgi:hypothetical protein
MNSTFAEIAGDFWRSIVGSKELLGVVFFHGSPLDLHSKLYA